MPRSEPPLQSCYRRASSVQHLLVRVHLLNRMKAQEVASEAQEVASEAESPKHHEAGKQTVNESKKLDE